jgi:ubiquinone/menaquinone biosynthesis C-methylase UbiE
MTYDEYVTLQRGEGFKSPRTKRAYERLAELRAEQMVKMMDRDAVKTVLDVGCRTGSAMKRLSELLPCAHITGVDIVPEVVAEAKTWGAARVADAHSLPFKDQEFDWTLCSHVLEHCRTYQVAKGEIYRVTKGGVFFVLPIETEDQFNASPSHFVWADDPLLWLARLDHDDWNFYRAERTPLGDLIAVFVRRPETING